MQMRPAPQHALNLGVLSRRFEVLHIAHAGAEEDDAIANISNLLV